MNRTKGAALEEACRIGKEEAAESLIADPTTDVNWADQQGFTPLWAACSRNHVALVHHLLNRTDLRPDQPQFEGATPLLFACQKGHAAIVRLLLGDPRVDPQQIPPGAGLSLSAMACQKGQGEVLQILLGDPRVDPNLASPGGVSPLWLACQGGHWDAVVRLLASHWPIKVDQVCGWNGTQPAQWARSNGHPDLADLIDLYALRPDCVRLALRRICVFDGLRF